MHCRLCLAAAATAALVLAGAVLIGWLLPLALAEVPARFTVCSTKTCAAVDEKVQDSLGSGSTVHLIASEVVTLLAVAGCDECTKVMSRSGKSVFVVGTPEGTACVLFGGQQCKERGAK